MKYHVITRNGILVGVTTSNAYEFNLPDVSIHEFDDAAVPDLTTHTWNQEADQFEMTVGILSKREFLTRFTLSERIAIRESTNPVVIDIRNLLDLAEFVRLNDPETQQSVGYLASIGLVSAQRMQEILG
jgi:hypothetical protein